jgi:membrane dipeptidase
MLKEHGGVVGLTFCPDFMAQQDLLVTDDYPRGFHLIYRFITEIIEHWGIELLAIGSDFDGLVDIEPGLEDPTAYPPLANFLLSKGMTPSEIYNIFYANAKRAIFGS